jgi:hypothetical protein
MKWSVGITTVPSRRKDLFPKTLASIQKAGFKVDRLFVDGEADPSSWIKEFNLPISSRYPLINTAANWILSLGEMYLRDPNADRYAVFQDDFVTCLGLREYLEWVGYPKEGGYLNLYTFPSNQALVPRDKIGFFESNQKGRGAVALIFDNPTVVALLTHPYMVARPKDIHRAHRSIDGGISVTMNLLGKKEWVSNPSLTYHTGAISSMGNARHKQTLSFRGESWDTRELIGKVKTFSEMGS